MDNFKNWVISPRIMLVIIVTGTPGTGKTTIAKELSTKLRFKYLDVDDIIKNSRVQEGYDRKRKTKVINISKLKKVFIKAIKNQKNKLNGIIIDSHLSHDIPAEYVDLCIVTKCSLKVLKSRLKNRGYPDIKIKENLEAEIFEVCLMEAKQNNHKVLEVDTTHGKNIRILIRDIRWLMK
jgi:adenylate kinase